MVSSILETVLRYNRGRVFFTYPHFSLKGRGHRKCLGHEDNRTSRGSGEVRAVSEAADREDRCAPVRQRSFRPVIALSLSAMLVEV